MLLRLAVFGSASQTVLHSCVPSRNREGTNWLEQMLVKMEHGEADTREIPMLEEISRQIEGHTICALGDAAAWPVQVPLRLGFCLHHMSKSACLLLMD